MLVYWIGNDMESNVHILSLWSFEVTQKIKQLEVEEARAPVPHRLATVMRRFILCHLSTTVIGRAGWQPYCPSLFHLTLTFCGQT